MQRQLRLEEEVEYLRTALAQLEVRVSTLEDREFELVSSAGATSESAARGGCSSSGVAAKVSSLPPLTAEREKILKEIGVWLRSCLENRRRGLSGREKLPGIPATWSFDPLVESYSIP